jgi:vancomycin resistance protein YoaR
VTVQPTRPRRGLPRRAPVVLSGALVGTALLYGGLLAANAGGVPHNTRVLGVAIGGLSHEQAAAVLTSALGDRAAQPIPATVAGRTVQVDPAAAGLSLDAEATVAAATAASWNPVTLLGRFLAGADLAPRVAVDESKLAAAVAGLAKQLDQQPREGGVAVKGTAATAVQPVAGRTLDRRQAATAIRAAYLAGTAPVALPVVEQQPVVDAAEVQRVLTTVARPALSGPVRLLAGTTQVEVPASQLARFLSFRPSGGRLVPAFDGAGLQKELAGRLPGTVVAAKDATFRIVNGKPVVVPSVAGQGLDPAALSAAMLTVLPRTTDRTATVPLTVVQPKLTTAQAQALGVTEMVSTFTQRFPYAPYRKQNIGQAVQRINGTLLLPGQTYSQNETVKERTAANGYTIGTIILNGRFFEDYGGGVSTATTALWHTVFYAGLERVEQRAHSFWIARYQAGLEATVSWGSLDLKFRNDSPYGVFITARSGNDFVTTTIWSTKRYTIKAESGPRTNVTPPKTVYDPSTTCVPQPGVAGFDIVVTRVFLRDGVVVRREPLRTSYDPAPQVYCRPAPTASASPSASASGASPAPPVVVTPSPTTSR